MGKVNLAFDHIKDKNVIIELSVVLYTDSFFYGLWGADNLLLKSGYHPLESLNASVKLWSYYYDLKKINILSAIKPYVHLANEDFEKEHFEFYFKGLYNLERLDNHEQATDNFKAFDITTLHYLNKQVIDNIKTLEFGYQSSHISTALSRYATESKINWVGYIANNILHVCLHYEGGFRLYNQFDCFYESDYIYYLSLIADRFEKDRESTPLLLGGELNDNPKLKKMLRKYFGNVSYFDTGIKMDASAMDKLPDYYDLYLCKTCVS